MLHTRISSLLQTHRLVQNFVMIIARSLSFISSAHVHACAEHDFIRIIGIGCVSLFSLVAVLNSHLVGMI